MRLIDAEQFKNKINNSELYSSEEWVKVLDMLADCDSIDAVPVTRCKDCVYFAKDDEHGDAEYCSLICGLCKENDFCSFGRKEEKTDERKTN